MSTALQTLTRLSSEAEALRKMCQATLTEERRHQRTQLLPKSRRRRCNALINQARKCYEHAIRLPFAMEV